MKYTVVTIKNSYQATVAQTKLRWNDEDGPTAEDIRDMATSLIYHHWPQAGDTLYITEETSP